MTAALALVGVAALWAFGGSSAASRKPIVEFALFRNGPYFGASAAAFAVVGSYWAVMFFQPQYLQDARGHSAVLSGLMILPVTAPMVFISPFSGRLIGRFGARGLMTRGDDLRHRRPGRADPMGVSSSYALLLAGYLLFGVAMGLVYAPMSTAAMAAMPAEKVGIASGVLAMDRIVAGSIALAATGAAFHALPEEATRLPMRSPARPGSPSASASSAASSPGPSCVTRSARPRPSGGRHSRRALQHHAHHRRFHL